VLYSGNGTTNAITGVGFQPDLLWLKNRSQARAPVIYDVIRGVTKGWRSDTTAAEATSSSGYDLTAFNTDGFTVGEPENWNSTNENSTNIVAWNWKMGGAGGTSHTQGTRDTTVSANQDAGQSVMYWTGAGSGPYTLGHGLSKAPDVFIYKNMHDTSSVYVYHTSLSAPFSKRLLLNETDGEVSSIIVTATSSTLITVPDGGATDSPNRLTGWAFHSVDGYSKVGSYTGNDNADGAFVYTGFRPAWVLIKNTAASGSWYLYDSVREPYNVVGKPLHPNSNSAEGGGADRLDILSNGFKLRHTDSDLNDTETYIYLAFAETPFKYSNAR